MDKKVSISVVMAAIAIFAVTSLVCPVWGYETADLTKIKTSGSCSGCNLRGANLSGISLKGADLSGADFTGANLSGANLSKANLAGARLGDAVITGANLSGANLSGAKWIDGTICNPGSVGKCN